MAKADLRQFDYAKVAQLEVAIWRAYYQHKFLRFGILTYKLMKTQVGLGVFNTLRITYYFSKASAKYRRNQNHKDSKKIIRNLTKFYRVVSKHAKEKFDYAQAAEYELAWWDIHRYGSKSIESLAHGMAKTFAVVYKVKVSELMPYARYRAKATELRKKYMHQQKVEPNWTEIEELLAKSWAALHKAVNIE